MKTPTRLLSLEDREPNPEAIRDPSSAQFQLWLAQAQRDTGAYSSRELAAMERAANPMAAKSRTVFNPFTGEIRKVTF
jgi:hypothetical protein